MLALRSGRFVLVPEEGAGEAEGAVMAHPLPSHHLCGKIADGGYAYDDTSSKARGDLIEISEHGYFYTERMSGPYEGEYEDQTFAINERKLHIEGTDLFLQYRVHGNRLTLRDPLDGTEIVMRRVVES